MTGRATSNRVVEMPLAVFEQWRLRNATEPHHMQRTHMAIWVAWRRRCA